MNTEVNSDPAYFYLVSILIIVCILLSIQTYNGKYPDLSQVCSISCFVCATFLIAAGLSVYSIIFAWMFVCCILCASTCSTLLTISTISGFVMKRSN